MFVRNRELFVALLSMMLVSAGLIAGAWTTIGISAALWVAGVALVSIIIFIAVTWKRYREIQDLTSCVSSMVQGSRTLNLAEMQDGDLAALAAELDKLRCKLVLSAEHLEAEKNALAESLADVSHQIKTPLTSLALMTNLTRKRLSAAGHVEEANSLLDMEHLEERVSWLISALLKLARLDAGVVKLSRTTVYANDLVRRASHPLEVSFEVAEVELICKADKDAHFEGDLGWTAEALENILKNCLEHTPAGGCVTLRTWCDPLAFRIRVTDTGPGIAPSDVPHVFERFWRADSDQSEINPTGVGIGLSLAQTLISKQGGSVRAGNWQRDDGSVGGAQFDIVFPYSVL